MFFATSFPYFPYSFIVLYCHICLWGYCIVVKTKADKNWTLGEVDGYGLRKSDFGSEFVTYNKILGWDRQ